MNINIISTNKFDKEFKLSLRRGKKKENLDYFDTHTNFNPFIFK